MPDHAAVFTANANASPQIRREVERAVNRGVAILPLRVEDVVPGKGLEYFIGNVHWLDALTPPLEAHLKSLAGTIKILLARMEPHDPPPMPHTVAEEPRVTMPPEPANVRLTEPAVGAPAARAVAEEYAFESAGRREQAPAPRRFWSARTWTWAAGTVSVMLLGAVFVGVHFTSRPAPVGLPAGAPMPGGAPNPGYAPSPVPAATPSAPKTAKPAATSPGSAAGNSALQETMKTLQDELNSIGTVSFTAFNRNTANGSVSQYAAVNRVSNVVADPAQCHVSYHWTVWRNGAAQPLFNEGFSFLLHDVTSVVVEPVSQVNTEGNAAGGHSNLVQTSTAPPMTALVVHMSSRRNYFPFAKSASASRAAKTLVQAVKLCGGQLGN